MRNTRFGKPYSMIARSNSENESYLLYGLVEKEIRYFKGGIFCKSIYNSNFKEGYLTVLLIGKIL